MKSGRALYHSDQKLSYCLVSKNVNVYIVGVCIFSKEFFPITDTSMDLTFIYCKYKYIVTKLTTSADMTPHTQINLPVFNYKHITQKQSFKQNLCRAYPIFCFVYSDQ